MTSRLMLLSLVCSLATVGCASTQKSAPGEAVASKPAANSADARRELLAALERELEPLQTRPVQGPQDRFSGSVEASGDLVFEDDEDFTLIDIPIGTQTPIKCFIYRDSIDVGQSLQAMISALATDLQVEALRPTEIVAAGDRPALFLELDYTSDAGNGVRAAGQVKLLAAPDDDLPLVCFHDEVGYRRSFRRITQALAASIQPTGNSPRFAEILVYKVNDIPFGFEHRRIWEAQNDQKIVETTTVRLVPQSKKEFSFQDTVSTVVSDLRGRISQYAYAKAINGELVLQATMERGKGNVYAVQGTKDGKEFQASLQSKDKAGLPSDLIIQRDVKEILLLGKKPEVVFETYQPTSDPTALREVKYRKTGTSARSVTLELEGSTLDGEVDEHGTVERLDFPLPSGAKMRMDRVLAQGTP